MPFRPGQSGNPKGRPKQADPRSELMQEICKKHHNRLKKIAGIAIKEALNEHAWAIKLCMEYFFPKPGTFVSVSREENKDVNVRVTATLKALSFEEQQQFLRLLKKGEEKAMVIEQEKKEFVLKE